jgi:cytochrome c oxidase subunit 3
MWAFLSTEVLFFGGVLGAFAVVETMYGPAMQAARSHLNITLGAVNTGVLLCSSLAMALAVRASQLRQHRETVWLLVATIVLGSAFLGVKFYEWSVEYHEALVPGIRFDLEKYPGRQILFWSFYFTLTSIHALHMIIGVVIMAIMAVLVQRRWFSGAGSTQIEMLGLYWHFVDIVWVFLYPILYLINHR